MRGFVANTDYDWFNFLRAIEPPVDEVNFWTPGSDISFKALQPGEPFLFRLKAPHNVIGGFGVFAHFSALPVSMAWEVYGPANGAPTLQTMRSRLLRIRDRFEMGADAKQDFWIGCILINQPVFFERRDWVRIPDDWSANIVRGKGYDLEVGEGQRVWLECLARSTKGRAEARPGVAVDILQDRQFRGGFGPASFARPRLGQRSFRVAVLDSYGRRCAVTSERTLPALEAAHIRDYHEVQEHTLSNGILFRADIHRLFDSGYVTVTPDHHFEVSRRIKEEFENGRDYYKLHGNLIRLPERSENRPAADALSWHNAERYLG
jgi:putative restriction endonuclease